MMGKSWTNVYLWSFLVLCDEYRANFPRTRRRPEDVFGRQRPTFVSAEGQQGDLSKRRRDDENVSRVARMPRVRYDDFRGTLEHVSLLIDRSVELIVAQTILPI